MWNIMEESCIQWISIEDQLNIYSLIIINNNTSDIFHLSHKFVLSDSLIDLKQRYFYSFYFDNWKSWKKRLETKTNIFFFFFFFFFKWNFALFNHIVNYSKFYIIFYRYTLQHCEKRNINCNVIKLNVIIL